MKKILLSLVCLIAGWQFAFAEEPALYDIVREKLDSVFYYVNKEAVPTGLLAEYGFHLAQLDSYNGIPTDSNYVSRMEWEMLYAGLYDSQINSRIRMREPDEVYEQAKGNLSVMYYKYNTLADDAVERGLAGFVDGRLQIDNEPGVYVEKECFAVVPVDGSLPLVFDKNNFFTNTGLDIKMVEYKIDNGSYRAIPFSGGAVRVPTGTSPGEYDITFRVTFSNGKTMESHSIVSIEGSATSFPPDFTSDSNAVVDWETINADSNQSGGRIQVKYMKNTPAKNGEFVRPLIIVEDMDLSALSSKLKMDLSGLLSQGGGIGDAIDQLSQLYDIIYIDFNDGLDDMIRNSTFLWRALKEIDKNKLYPIDNYIIGIGTGGLISRLAINAIEESNENISIKKFISINSPFRGFNIPISLQGFIRQAYALGNDLKIVGKPLRNVFSPYVSFLNSKIMQQLLLYNTLDGINVIEHNPYINKNLLRKIPQKCETISVTTGDAHSNTLYGIDKQTIYIESTIYGFGGKLFGVGTDIGVRGYTMPNKKSEEVYYGAMRAFFSAFWTKTHLAKVYRSIVTNDETFPVDGTSGTYIETGFINDLAKSVNSNLGEIMKTDKFCFVPTFSALDLDAEKYFAADDLEDLRGEMNADRAYWTGSNDSYPGLSGIVDILMQELAPAIKGETENILDDTELYIDNLPDIPNLTIPFDWTVRNGNFRVVSQEGSRAVVRPLAYSEFDYADTVSVNISVNLPMLSIPPMSTPTVRITPHTIRIDGSSYITAGAQTFELDTLPKNAGTVEWTAGENIKISRQGEKSATAYATEYSEDAWIEASFAVGDDRYNIRKDLIASRLDSVTGMKMEQTWWDKEVAADKYFFKVELYPIYMPPQEIHFCWSNTVRIYDKDGNLKRANDSNDDDDRFPPTMVDPGGLVVDYGFIGNGMAEIETPGDVGICQFAVEHPGGPAIPADSLIFGRGGGYDHLIMPTSTDYPPGEIDPIITIPALTGPNCAIVTMPALGTDLGDYAAGEIRCDISDDYGNRYRVSYYVRTERGVVYHNYSVSPNPTSDRLDVKMKVEGDASMSEPSPMTVKLYGDTGLVREATFDDPVAGGSIDVSNLPEGTYYMNLEINGTVVKRQVVLIQR